MKSVYKKILIFALIFIFLIIIFNSRLISNKLFGKVTEENLVLVPTYAPFPKELDTFNPNEKYHYAIMQTGNQTILFVVTHHHHFFSPLYYSIKKIMCHPNETIVYLNKPAYKPSSDYIYPALDKRYQSYNDFNIGVFDISGATGKVVVYDESGHRLKEVPEQLN